MTYFIVAIVLFSQQVGESISIMEKPYSSKEECKQAIVKDGKLFQEDIMVIYPNASRFSIVCIDDKTIKSIIRDMESNSIGKQI